MRHTRLVLCLSVALCPPAWPQGPVLIAEESLGYEVNWPSGLSLGEARLRAAKAAAAEGADGEWDLEFVLDAAVPGVAVADVYRSLGSADLCSVRFDKQISRGATAAREQTRFDRKTGTATRETIGGGSSQFSTGPCARDALAFLYYLRSELSQGRLPPPQTIYFGGPYRLRLEFAGRRRVAVGGEQVDADLITATLEGPASNTSFDLLFAQDRTRRPLLIRIQLPLGSFSMELAP